MPAGAETFVQISGTGSSGISLVGNSFEPDRQIVIYSDGATVEALELGVQAEKLHKKQ
jgi:hypothetical protein